MRSEIGPVLKGEVPKIESKVGFKLSTRDEEKLISSNISTFLLFVVPINSGLCFIPSSSITTCLLIDFHHPSG